MLFEKWFKYLQEYYFISINDNDNSLFIVIKKGDEPIFKNKNKLTIITPCCRPNNLIKLYDSINFNYINEWIVVYDEKKIKQNPNILNHFNNKKIKEYFHRGNGISGNPQRNRALDKIENKNTMVYYLDDDNIIHEAAMKPGDGSFIFCHSLDFLRLAHIPERILFPGYFQNARRVGIYVWATLH